MFNLEKATAEWRARMESAGMENSACLDELEAHLREDVEHRMRSGEQEPVAFANAVRELGQATVLKCEFKKNERFGEKKWGILAIIAGFIVFGRVVMMHEAGRVGPGDEIGGILMALFLLFFGLNSFIFKFNLGTHREIRLWKLTGLTYSVVAVWLSLFPILRVFTFGKHGWEFGVTHWILTLTAVMISVFTNLIWRMCRKLLPPISSQLAIAVVGTAGCLVGPALMALFFYFGVPALIGHVPTQTFFVGMAWLWALMALLAGAGLGLTKAAGERTDVLAVAKG